MTHHSLGSVAAWGASQSLVFRVSRQKRSEALGGGEAITADLVFIKVVL